MHALTQWLWQPKQLQKVMSLWPPFLGAGIKITHISDDYRCVRVALKHRWWNRNANRTQYGGSLFSLTDPIYSLMLMGVLGEKYYVWDKQASIEFIRPGVGDVRAEFVICQETVEAILQATQSGNKHFPQFITEVKNQQGEVVCVVKRTLYVKRKPQYR